MGGSITAPGGGAAKPPGTVTDHAIAGETLTQR